MPGPVHESSRPQWFLTTHWSVVLAAAAPDPERAREALETLCRSYWYPLYAFVRRLGHPPQNAEDLVQAFFARCLQGRYFEAADREKGRFRSFLLLALKRFLANEWDKGQAQKRGGATPPISLDALTAEQRYALEPRNEASPDQLFERRWALTVLEKVLARLQAEQGAAGRLEAFELLKESLVGAERQTGYADVAAALGTTEGAVKVAVHRLRRRYRELLHDEIAQTVSTPAEVEEERRYLFAVLSRSTA